MASLFAQYGLLLVALIIFAGEIGFPTLVPGEIALLIAGAHFIHSLPVLIGMAIVFGLVDIVATSTIHVASRTAGNRLLLRLLGCICQTGDHREAMVERWRHRLGGHDSLVVLVTRMIPMLRLYASITTGLIRIRFRDFVLGAAPASLVWASIPLTTGYLLRRQITGVEQHYGLMTYLVVIASVLVIVLLVAGGWVRRTPSTAARLRRVRLIIGLAAVSGVLARLVTLALYAHRLAPDITSILSIWVVTASLVALGLLWVATRDIHGIHIPEHRIPGIAQYRGAVWVSLMLMFGAVTAWGAVQYPPLLT